MSQALSWVLRQGRSEPLSGSFHSGISLQGSVRTCGGSRASSIRATARRGGSIRETQVQLDRRQRAGSVLGPPAERTGEGGSPIRCASLPRIALILVLHPEKSHSPRQTGTVGHPTWGSKAESTASLSMSRGWHVVPGPSTLRAHKKGFNLF